MDAVGDSSVALPGQHPRAESNGETTRRLSAALHQVVAGDEVEPDAIDKLGKTLADIFAQGNGDGGGDGSAHVKVAKKQNYIAIVLMLLSGAGGGVGSYYALKALATSNAHEIQHLKTLEPLIKKNQEDIRFIKVDVSGINKSMGDVKAQSTEIVKGIKALKQEKVDKLVKDLEDADREIRRLRRFGNED